MTNEEAKKKLEAKLVCLNNMTSGINYDCNMQLCDGCSLNYEQGTVGELKDALYLAIKALEITEQVNTSHNGVQMFPKGRFKSIYDNESVISTKVVTDYIKSHIHEIISESGRDLNEHTNQVLRSIIKGVEEYQESED